MKRYVADKQGKVIDTEEATPVCGEDFCDDCGDCLVCYCEDSCRGVPGLPRQHYWVRYL